MRGSAGCRHGGKRCPLSKTRSRPAEAHWRCYAAAGRGVSRSRSRRNSPTGATRGTACEGDLREGQRRCAAGDPVLHHGHVRRGEVPGDRAQPPHVRIPGPGILRALRRSRRGPRGTARGGGGIRDAPDRRTRLRLGGHRIRLDRLHCPRDLLRRGHEGIPGVVAHQDLRGEPLTGRQLHPRYRRGLLCHPLGPRLRPHHPVRPRLPRPLGPGTPTGAETSAQGVAVVASRRRRPDLRQPVRGGRQEVQTYRDARGVLRGLAFRSDRIRRTSHRRCRRCAAIRPMCAAGSRCA